MIFIILVVILPINISVILSILLGATIIHMAKTNAKYNGKDLYLTMLLSFVIPGAGIVYLGSPRKGMFWYLIQVTGLMLSYTLHKYNVEGRSVGLMIMIPFILQLLATGLEYNSKYGGLK